MSPNDMKIVEERKQRQRVVARQYRARNKKKLKERHKRDVQTNPDKYKKRRARQRTQNPFVYKLLSVRDRAKKKNLECTITSAHLESIWTGVCPIFETKIEIGQACQWGRSNLNSVHLASLDRKDSSKGYVEGNVQWISNLANVMKNRASKEQLLRFSQWILKLNTELT